MKQNNFAKDKKGFNKKMRKFEVAADSTCDFTAKEIEDSELYVGHLVYTISKGDELLEEEDKYTSESEYASFYDRLKNGYIAKTSILNVQTHVDLFTNMAKKGIKTALYICQSYGLSPTLDNANKAIEIVKKEYPTINYVAVEANTTTCAEGFIVKACIKCRDEGKSLDETIEIVKKIKHLTQHFILANDLKFLARGGRISKTSANIGSLLQVKPIICFNKEGKLEIARKEIGLKKALNSIVNDFAKYTMNKQFPYICIVHTGNEPLAKELQGLFKVKYNIEPEIRWMGPIIGAHVGPNGVAYTFISNEERPF